MSAEFEIDKAIARHIRKAIDECRLHYDAPRVFSIAMGTIVGSSYAELGPIATIKCMDNLKDELNANPHMSVN